MTSSRTLVARRSSQYASKVSLASRDQINKPDAGLALVQGAQELVSLISSRKSVKKLIVGHNELGDDGCMVLFRFLGTSNGRRHPITQISLGYNSIGNQGLRAITDYLKNNQYLEEIFLTGNRFTDNPSVAEELAAAINSSRLRALHLNGNSQIGDTFMTSFLDTLASPHLRELQASSMGMSPVVLPSLIDYISSPERCYLQTLKCNANNLGLLGVRSVIQSIEQSNYRLSIVELYANQYEEIEIPGGSESESTWAQVEKLLKRVLARNAHLRRQLHTQALSLLRCSRVLMLHSRSRQIATGEDVSTQAAEGSLVSSPPTGFRFRALPLEVQQHILSFVAPSLSVSQHLAVLVYASSPDTLPRLLPPLPLLAGVSEECLPDPSNLEFSTMSSSKSGVWKLNDNNTSTGGACEGGTCMGAKSLFCYREKEREKWFALVGCDFYVPPGR